MKYVLIHPAQENKQIANIKNQKTQTTKTDSPSLQPEARVCDFKKKTRVAM